MDNIEQQLRAFENDVNAEKNIRDAITKAYGGLKPELETINTYENEQFPAFYDAFQGGDMGAAGLDPASRLANAWREAGRASTSANVARGAFDVRRAGMEDLIASALKDRNDRYGMLSNAWNRELQLRQLARSGGGGAPVNPWENFEIIDTDGDGKPDAVTPPPAAGQPTNVPKVGARDQLLRQGSIALGKGALDLFNIKPKQFRNAVGKISQWKSLFDRAKKTVGDVWYNRPT